VAAGAAGRPHPPAETGLEAPPAAAPGAGNDARTGGGGRDVARGPDPAKDLRIGPDEPDRRGARCPAGREPADQEPRPQRPLSRLKKFHEITRKNTKKGKTPLTGLFSCFFV